jgi:hypothetical protein
MLHILGHGNYFVLFNFIERSWYCSTYCCHSLLTLILVILKFTITLHYKKSHVISLYGSTALRTLAVFFSVYQSYTQSVGLLGRGSARRKAATYTQNNTNRINAHRYPCLEWDSIPRPKYFISIFGATAGFDP